MNCQRRLLVIRHLLKQKIITLTCLYTWKVSLEIRFLDPKILFIAIQNASGKTNSLTENTKDSGLLSLPHTSHSIILPLLFLLYLKICPMTIIYYMLFVKTKQNRGTRLHIKQDMQSSGLHM